MPSINDIVDAMVAKLDEAYDGLEVQVLPHPFAKLTTPSIVIRVGDGSDEAAGFGDFEGEIGFVVSSWVSVGDSEGSWRLLYDMLDSQSDYCIVVPLMDDTKLNGTASAVRVESPTGPYEFHNPDGGRLVGYRWRVTVIRAL